MRFMLWRRSIIAFMLLVRIQSQANTFMRFRYLHWSQQPGDVDGLDLVPCTDHLYNHGVGVGRIGGSEDLNHENNVVRQGLATGPRGPRPSAAALVTSSKWSPRGMLILRRQVESVAAYQTYLSE